MEGTHQPVMKCLSWVLFLEIGLCRLGMRLDKSKITLGTVVQLAKHTAASMCQKASREKGKDGDLRNAAEGLGYRIL